jgi:1-deoxy-D-xylulose-5-phosphate reductoisomerase
MKRKIGILGSTGSIGVQALQVIRTHPEMFEVSVLTGNRNADLLIEQAREFNPHSVVIAETKLYTKVKEALNDRDVQVYAGEDALEQVASYDQTDIVLTALVGASGLRPTLSALKAGKPIALANKETLVVAGEIVTELSKKMRAPLLPVDSEHSAIFQCLSGETQNKIEKIILTASGGPFRGRNRHFLEGVTAEQALRHPNWTMGAKITIDSATLMNKGLEVIEAHWLFGTKPEEIEVIVHPQSIIHSMVQFQDGSIIAQMGLPDMKLPIQYALAYPNRIKNNFPRFEFHKFPQLSFEEADMSTFRCLGLAYETLKRGGNSSCILNAANEIAVQAFLENRINFLEIAELSEQALLNIAYIEHPNINELLETDLETRNYTEKKIKKKTHI